MKECPKPILKLFLAVRKLGVAARKPLFKKGLSRAYAQAFEKLKAASGGDASPKKDGLFAHFSPVADVSVFDGQMKEVGSCLLV